MFLFAASHLDCPYLWVCEFPRDQTTLRTCNVGDSQIANRTQIYIRRNKILEWNRQDIYIYIYTYVYINKSEGIPFRLTSP